MKMRLLFFTLFGLAMHTSSSVAMYPITPQNSDSVALKACNELNKLLIWLGYNKEKTEITNDSNTFCIRLIEQPTQEMQFNRSRTLTSLGKTLSTINNNPPKNTAILKQLQKILGDFKETFFCKYWLGTTKDDAFKRTEDAIKKTISLK